MASPGQEQTPDFSLKTKPSGQVIKLAMIEHDIENYAYFQIKMVHLKKKVTLTSGTEEELVADGGVVVLIVAILARAVGSRVSRF